MMSIENSDETTKLPLIERVYQWSSGYSHEVAGKLPDYYHVTNFAKRVKARIEHLNGRLFAIRGLQGIGKTSLGNWLAQEDDVFFFKWDSDKEVDDYFADPEFFEFDPSRLLTEIKLAASVFESPMQFWDKKSRPPLSINEYRLIEGYMNGSHTPDSTLFRLARRVLPDKIIRSLQRVDILEEASTVVFDFADYDKSSASKARKDFEKLQKWWDKERAKPTTLEDDTGNPVRLNILVLWQQEIWKDTHFFQDKFIIETMPKMSVEDMCSTYVQEFDDFHPFTLEALIILGKQANGIMRAFKRLVFQFTEKVLFEDLPTPIDEELVKKTLTIPLLGKRIQEQANTMFPNSDQRRGFMVGLLHRLRMGDEVWQKDCGELFGVSKDIASKTLDVMEEHGFIKREIGPHNRKLIKETNGYE